MHTLKLLRRDDLQVREYLRNALTTSEHACVGDIDENVLDGRVVKGLSRAEIEKTLLFERGGGFPATVAILVGQVKDAADGGSLHGIDLNVIQLPIFLAHAPLFYQLIAVRSVPAAESPLHNDLSQTSLGTDGGLDALARRLPVTDVIQQLVHMIIESLLAFLGTPDLNAVVDKPLHNKRRFVITASKAVEHKHKKNIKGAQGRFPLDLLYSVPLLSGDLEAGHALF